ncbi:hypothetical protein LCGC14_1430540 [marine sediment metagenome]|uniref:Antitoxin SocA-like Panacea domain-containing protein n=1 Tax=marine sediment metagenome TaxID=412755 RepID=A0A0F9M485_9ZZZZ
MYIDAKVILYMLMRDFKLKRKTIEDRQRLQKTIYLLQAYGLQLGYGFSWFKYGPYSSDIIEDAYEVSTWQRFKDEGYFKELNECKFSKNSIKEFKNFRKILKGVLNNLEQLELIASVDFVKYTWHTDKKKREFAKAFKKQKSLLFDEVEITQNMIFKAFDISNILRKEKDM